MFGSQCELPEGYDVKRLIYRTFLVAVRAGTNNKKTSGALFLSYSGRCFVAEAGLERATSRL